MKKNLGNVIAEENERRIPVSYKKAVIINVHSDSWSADVNVVGDYQSLYRNIPLSSAIPSDVRNGDRCKVDLFDESNPNDMVVAYLYGRKYRTSYDSVYD
jgi:hypothetical protein